MFCVDLGYLASVIGLSSCLGSGSMWIYFKCQIKKHKTYLNYLEQQLNKK